MVEGPLLHRLAFIHRQLFFGHRFVATSPTGRFKDGSAAINGLVLSHIEVHGKNMFYFFTPEKVEEEGVLEKVGDDAVVVHIHMGMSGSFRLYQSPGPVPREATRLCLYNEEIGLESHLSASVCDYGNIELYRKKIMELGPDPLRKDADKELLWGSMQKTKKSIGAVLMDQSLVAGIGNIYRAEILFVVGLHPDKPASTVSREAFEFLWEQSVRQMEIGVELGNIITVLPENEGKPLPKNATARSLRYVYNQKACGKCDGAIKVWTIAQRTVYACEACQPPPLSITTVSKRSMRKTTVDEADSNPAESGGDVDDDGEIYKKKPKLPRKKVAKGGRVAVHQAYKTPKELPESLMPPDVKEFHERFGEDGRNLEEFGQAITPMQKNGDDKATIKYSRRGKRGNQADQLQKDMVNDSAPSEKLPERRSARLKTQAVAPSSTPLGFRVRKKRTILK